MMDLKYSEILSLNRELLKKQIGKPLDIKILSNITTAQLNDLLEFQLRSVGIPVEVSSGDFNNIVQNSKDFTKADVLVIFWELCGIMDGFYYKAESLDFSHLSALIERVKGEIDFVLKNLSQTPIVIFNRFSTRIFASRDLRQGKFEDVCSELNNYLLQNKPSNVILVDVDQVISDLSIQKSIDLRYFYSSKALYSISFFKSYAAYISPGIKSLMGKAKKAIIFDCDNTLWKGILGEDGFDNIQMSSESKEGIVFEEVQYQALEFVRSGILVGLCSKNNADDVKQVLNSHPDMRLREKDISAMKINWIDKVQNLRDIAVELNIS
jgi:HAD superfamily phosphatase (TIGR01681 family)